MMARSDRHCRYFWRLLSKKALLYTEMVTSGALLHGDRARLLDYSEQEHPLALQLGGSDAGELAKCARWARDWGYDEVNLNCGCPSSRVQSGRFGACLMAQPALVKECVVAMREAAALPVTIKHRIGIDHWDSYSLLLDFVGTVAESGATTFIIHARKAWLRGLSPRENREIPALRYDWVYQLKRDFPQLEIVINGGIGTLAEAERHLAHVDGVMLGRAIYRNPYLLAKVDQRLFNEPRDVATRESILLELLTYSQQQLEVGVRMHHITRHIPGLFRHEPGARKFRRHLGERSGAGIELLSTALHLVRDEIPGREVNAP
ncbi:MAG: tRNA dihydrouridine(20/20a) synthase DusA [Halieaceae bacterium]|nr:tRNA dihydrouridine(20/20a) synthase DusA [Halieaceae bacterium]